MMTTVEHIQQTCWRRIVRFLKRQLLQIQQGGRAVLFRKMKRSLQILLNLPLYILAVPVALVFRLIKPWFLVRFGGLVALRIGHFAANTEQYLCERDAGINVPNQRYIDLFYMAGSPICNQQLAIMWRRVLRVWPAWFLFPIDRVNRLIPGGAVHEIGNNTQHDRDVHNLLDRYPPHLEFSLEEERKGLSEMVKLGIPNTASWICFHDRSPDYLKNVLPGEDYSYHDYRDCDIKKFIPAAEELCRRGNFLVRTGAIVKEPLEITHLQIIDYAWNSRSEFLDIYLGAKCKFYLGPSTGISSVPAIFRRPVAFVNVASVEYVVSWGLNNLSIFKKVWLIKERRFMTFQEIFDSGAGRFFQTKQFELLGVELIENTPEEITALAVEMDERLDGTWQTTEEDEELQRRFWAIFPITELNGVCRARIGTEFLRQYQDLLK